MATSGPNRGPNRGTLYVIATPIGNLEDLSARALRILREVTLVYAEDTRRSRGLFSHFGITTSLSSLHEHNERARSQEVIARLEKGDSVALISDAGTPAVSDPGAHLVHDITQAGYNAVPVPGASALIAALSVSGFVAADVLYMGFVPPKGAERTAALNKALQHRGLVVIFEAPHRIGDTLSALAAGEPERPVAVCRELTKMHEEVRRGTLQELASWAAGEVLGELVIVLGPTTRVEVSATDAQIDAALARCLEAGLSKRDAATAVAAVLDRSKREVYERVNRL